MKVEESIDERALRLLHGSESNQPNAFFKNTVMNIPLIPYDCGEANKILYVMRPSEDVVISPNGYDENTMRESWVDDHAEIQEEGREPSILTSDYNRCSDLRDESSRDTEDTYARYACDEEVCNGLNSAQQRFEKVIECSMDEHGKNPLWTNMGTLEDNSKFSHGIADVGRDRCSNFDNFNDFPRASPLQQMRMSQVSIISPLFDELHSERKNLSLHRQTSLSSAEDTASVLRPLTPSIGRLKARKRLLERFLSDHCVQSFVQVGGNEL